MLLADECRPFVWLTFFVRQLLCDLHQGNEVIRIVQDKWISTLAVICESGACQSRCQKPWRGNSDNSPSKSWSPEEGLKGSIADNTLATAHVSDRHVVSDDVHQVCEPSSPVTPESRVSAGVVSSTIQGVVTGSQGSNFLLPARVMARKSTTRLLLIPRSAVQRAKSVQNSPKIWSLGSEETLRVYPKTFLFEPKPQDQDSKTILDRPNTQKTGQEGFIFNSDIAEQSTAYSDADYQSGIQAVPSNVRLIVTQSTRQLLITPERQLTAVGTSSSSNHVGEVTPAQVHPSKSTLDLPGITSH